MLKRKDILVTSLIMAGFLLLNIVIIRNAVTRRGEEKMPSYSTYDSDPFGCRAIMLLFRRLGYPVVQWKRPLSKLEGKGSLLFCIQPPPIHDDVDIGSLRQWVGSGNVAVIISNSENPVADEFDIRFDYTGDTEKELLPFLYSKPENPASLVRSTYSAGVEKIKVHSRARFQLLKQEHTPYFGDEKGMVALSFQVEKGKIFFISDPRIAANKHINEEDNVVFLANILLADGALKRVIFDEHIHGHHERKSFFTVLKRSPVGGALLQAAFGLLLFFYAKGKRFGAPSPIQAKAVGRSSMEYVRSMAHIYRIGEARSLVLGQLFSSFLKSVARKLGINKGTSKEEILKAARARKIAGLGALEKIIEGCDQALSAGKMSDAKFVALAKDLAQMEKERK